MAPLKQTAFRIPDDVIDSLQEIKERVGIPVSEQVRRALLAWIQEHGAKVKAERRRAATRKRP